MLLIITLGLQVQTGAILGKAVHMFTLPKALGSFLTFFVPTPITRHNWATWRLSGQIYQSPLSSLYLSNDLVLTESSFRRVKTDMSPLQTLGILVDVILSDILEVFPLSFCRFQRPVVASPKSTSPGIQPSCNKMEMACL